MKQTLFIMLFALFATSLMAQKTIISGVVKDAGTGLPLEGITIRQNNTPHWCTSNSKGYYALETDVFGEAIITYSNHDFSPFQLKVFVERDKAIEMSEVSLQRINVASQDIPTISLADSDADNAAESQTIHGLLSSSSDVFVKAAAYTFGPARFRIRGYESNHTAVTINGFIANDLEFGSPYWSDWGGLNDVMRNTVITNDSRPSGYMFDPLGGSTNIITKPSEYRTGTKVTYSSSNRTYRNRAMVTHSTGMMDNGWAVTASYSRRWSEKGYVEGTFYDAHSMFLAVEKRFNARHTLNFTALNSYYRRGQAGASTQEVYDMVDDNYYNPNWGYQDGEVRNARVRHNNKPLFTLSHNWTISEATKLTTTAGYWFGKDGGTALNWQGAADPRPDYYRYLPSYFINPADQARIKDQWQSNPKVSQIDWDKFYYANRQNYEAIFDAQGKEVARGLRAKYMVEDRVNSLDQMQFNSILKHDFNTEWNLTGGLNFNRYVNHVYNEVEDLLGADYWYDIDQFAERDFKENPDAYQNDLRNPYRVVKEGDKYSHNYKMHHYEGGLWAIANYKGSNYSVYGGGSYSYVNFWREGLYQKGLFKDNSYGNSEKTDLHNYGVKLGGEYRITGRHIITTNLAQGQRAPIMRNVFISPRTRNDLVDGLKSETYYSADLSYVVKMPRFNGRLTGYYTRVNDAIDVKSFYHEEEKTFVNYTLSGIDKEYKGLELAAEYKISSTLTANAAASLGRYLYKSEPNYLITKDNSRETLQTGTVYSKNFRLNGMPQTAATVGITYNAPQFWWIGINGTYFDDIYIDFNPVKRVDADYWSAPEKQKEAFTIDAFCGKSFRWDGYYLSISANLSNITNNKDFITGGYEQLRFDSSMTHLHQPKYFYSYGFNYFINASLSF